MAVHNASQQMAPAAEERREPVSESIHAKFCCENKREPKIDHVEDL